jgi:alpha-methylacyl-CoA racemase
MPTSEPGRLPLAGIRVIDVSSLGPGPFCSMLLADYGAEVVTVRRPDPEPFDPGPMFARGKQTIVVDLKAEDGPEVIRELTRRSDVFLEGYRPGVMERLGLGPDVLMADNPRLIYTRLTGYGQTGPYAPRVGHDINYISIGGGLGAIGRDEPAPPLNILGDFAGGSVNAVLGILLALLERRESGAGQVVDAAMVDGVALLLSAQLAFAAMGKWEGRGRSELGGNAPHYSAYECADGRWFSVGAIEQRFYLAMVEALGLDHTTLLSRDDPANWPKLRDTFATVFAQHSRDYWTARFATIDGCGSPVLEIDELAEDPHLKARGSVVTHDGIAQAAPAPRFGATAFPVHSKADGPDIFGVLRRLGFDDGDVNRWAASRALPDAGLSPTPGTERARS